jgi:putative peptidoglycan lipid II flippase
MNTKQFFNAGILFAGQLLIKGSSFIKQLILAYFLGVSADVDLLLVAQIVPNILASMIAGGAGEVLVTFQKKGKSYDQNFVSLFIFSIAAITLLTGLIYLLSAPAFLNLFKIGAEQQALFWSISLVVVFSKIPAAFVSGLQHLLYAKGKYKFFVISSLFSELAGIGTILLMVKSSGILAFAYGLLMISSVNAVLFIYAHQLNLSVLFNIKEWKAQFTELASIMKRTFSLSLQTLLNHLSTFWERTLSIRFLNPGFLSALNYSKNLSELPKMAMLSSILTTTYIEQVNRKSESEEEYVKYSNRMEKLLSEIAFVFQSASILFGPFILVALFKRGAFDNDAVEKTFLIYQILTVGFVPGLMMNFLSRTMYIELEYKKMFYIILGKFLLEVGIMSAFIQQSQFAIPYALIAGKFLASLFIFFYLSRKKPGIFNTSSFIIIYSLLLLSSVAVIWFNMQVLPWVLTKNVLELSVYYLPAIALFASIAAYLGYRTYGKELITVFRKKKKVKTEHAE